MSLYVYSGIPGSGKTFHAVSDIKFNNAPVITNISISGISNVATLPLSQINPSLLMAFSNYYFNNFPYKENSLLLVIDEAQLLFNARTWDSSDRFSWLEFLSQHRKYGFRCIFIAQDISMIDKQFRCLCEYDVRHVAAGSISFFTRFLANFGLRFSCAKYYFYDTDTLISRSFFPIKKSIYKHYDTSQDILSPSFSDVDLSPIIEQLEPF